MPFLRTRQVIDTAVAGSATPSVVVEVGRRTGAIWTACAGRLTSAPSSPLCTPATVYDLASLTKVIATTSLAARLMTAGRLDVDAPLGDWWPAWRLEDRHAITVRDLLGHSAGLQAHDRFWERASGRPAIEREIRSLPLVYEPGTQSLYSDLGFMLLGFLLEDLDSRPLDTQFDELMRALTIEGIRYRPPDEWRSRTAPTEYDPWRDRLLVGEVHDENAAALGGIAGHSGLFGTAAAVGAFARVVLASLDATTELASPAVMRRVTTKTGVPGSSRALGWDTMLPTSSCGSRLSGAAFGHTGFTGTSLWIDPDRDLYVVLLANRVHPSRANERFAAVRPQVHDAVVLDLDESPP